jgi:hypothetical protein
VAKPDPLTLYADTVLVDGWCLRSALVRYAQAEPVRSTVVHALMRRLDAALAAALDRARLDALATVVERFDGLAATMSTWAADRAAHSVPNDSVDSVAADVAALYDHLGVPEESIDPAEWKGMRSSEGRRPPRVAK